MLTTGDRKLWNFPNRHWNFTYIVNEDSQQCLSYGNTLILKTSKYGVDF